MTAGVGLTAGSAGTVLEAGAFVARVNAAVNSCAAGGTFVTLPSRICDASTPEIPYADSLAPRSIAMTVPSSATPTNRPELRE